MSVSWEPAGPPDPNDPRVVPSSMQFTRVRKKSGTCIEWNLAEGVRMAGGNPRKDRPYVLRFVLSPADARMIAQQLPDAADGVQPTATPPPPPPE